MTKIDHVINKHWLRLYGYSPEGLIFRSVRIPMEDIGNRSVPPYICLCRHNDNSINAGRIPTKFDVADLWSPVSFRLDWTSVSNTLHNGMHSHLRCLRMPVYYPIHFSAVIRILWEHKMSGEIDLYRSFVLQCSYLNSAVLTWGCKRAAYGKFLSTLFITRIYENQILYLILSFHDINKIRKVYFKTNCPKNCKNILNEILLSLLYIYLHTIT
jgi:hypothetical protein